MRFLGTCPVQLGLHPLLEHWRAVADLVFPSVASQATAPVLHISPKLAVAARVQLLRNTAVRFYLSAADGGPLFSSLSPSPISGARRQRGGRRVRSGEDMRRGECAAGPTMAWPADASAAARDRPCAPQASALGAPSGEMQRTGSPRPFDFAPAQRRPPPSLLPFTRANKAGRRPPSTVPPVLGLTTARGGRGAGTGQAPTWSWGAGSTWTARRWSGGPSPAQPASRRAAAAAARLCAATATSPSSGSTGAGPGRRDRG